MKIRLFDFGYETLPRRVHDKDAGLDVYARESILIRSGETVSIPLGFGVETPNGMMALLMPRSSMAKKGLVVQMPPIDAGYCGEIHAIMTNYSKEEYAILKNDRIAQLVFINIAVPDLVTYEADERGNGRFGSSGR